MSVTIDLETTVELSLSPCGCRNEGQCAAREPISLSPCGCRQADGAPDPAPLFS